MSFIKIVSPQTPLNGSIHIPGSKSYTNRALILASLSHGESVLRFGSHSSDSHALIAALKRLGVTIAPDEDTTSTIRVSGLGGSLPIELSDSGLSDGVLEIDVGPAGTAMRFLTAYCAALTYNGPKLSIVLKGSERMHERPIAPLVDSLRALGADISYLGKEGCPPLRITKSGDSMGSPLKGGEVTVDGSISSQFISALLMVAPLCAEPLSVTVKGPALSQSYIDMTMQSMSDFGIPVTLRHSSLSGNKEDCTLRKFQITPNARYTPKRYDIEGDASGASYFWALAAVSGGVITTTNINPSSAQGDVHFPQLLQRMGCSFTSTANSITVSGNGNLRAIEADMTNMPDTAQTLAVVAACAQGVTTLRGLSTLRVKETDRIAALQNELGKLGIKTESGPDYLVVHGGSPKPARVSTYEDHRMAMSFAVLAGKISYIEIENENVVEKSFPNFWQIFRGLSISCTNVQS